MKRIIVAAALAIAAPALAQQAQPSVVDQVDQALSMERAAANTLLNIKDQRIAALQAELDKAKAEACKKPESPCKSIDCKGVPKLKAN